MSGAVKDRAEAFWKKLEARWDRLEARVEAVAGELTQLRHDRTRDAQAAQDAATIGGFTHQFATKIWKAVNPDNHKQESALVEHLDAIEKRLTEIDAKLEKLLGAPPK